MNRPTALLLAALLVASLSAPQVFGQSRNNNQSRKLGSVIAGGRSSLIGSNVFVSVISGGMSNWIYTSLNSTNSPGVTIGGGIGNHVSGDLCTVSGGGTNDVWGEGATVAGGTKNTAAGNSCFVGGGFLNQARNYNAVVAGGWLNEATGNYSFIGGGQH